MLAVPERGDSSGKTYTISYSPGTFFHQHVKDQARRVYQEAGLKAKFVSLPHNRSLFSANDGSVDGDVGRVPSVEEKYPNLRRVQGKLLDLNGIAYTTNDKLTVYSENLLADYKVGYVLGVRWTEKLMRKHDGIAVRDYPALIRMLLEERVDLILATEASANAVIERLGERSTKIRKLRPYVFSAPIFHYVHKSNAGIIPILERAIITLKEKGEL